MRESRTIGEWMEHIGEWNESCQHGNATTTCETCVGALHPVLSTPTHHLQQLFTSQGSQSGTDTCILLKLSIETEELFAEIGRTFADLSDVEQLAGTTDQAAARELRDIGIIASDVRTLVEKLKPYFPDVDQHLVTAAVRQMQQA